MGAMPCYLPSNQNFDLDLREFVATIRGIPGSEP